ncbi:hypothetical protein [Paenibacillus sp. AN1007]|uniref:Uncharacterized protein n=1 Tax=Paenibacillus sp. AN1007 TaxID=3151385 RepID=A0AAU8N964_9BACL
MYADNSSKHSTSKKQYLSAVIDLQTFQGSSTTQIPPLSLTGKGGIQV